MKKIIIPDFIQIPTHLLRDDSIRHLDRILYGFIYWYSKLKMEKCTASNSTLAKQVGCVSGTVSNSLSRLSKAGFIKVVLENGSRKEIIPLVSYGHTPSSNDEPPSSNDEHNKNNNKNIKEYLDIYITSFNQLFERNYQSTEKRRSHLEARLKKFSLDEILKALENLSKSPWHRGLNDRGWQADPNFLIRNDDQVDKWLNKDMDESKKLSKLNRRMEKNARSKISKARL